MVVFYLILCVLGAVLPLSQFIPFLLEHGVAPGLFVAELSANRISSFFGLDVIISAVVLVVFVLSEGRRQGMRHLWAFVAGTLLVGVSFGLPLFLLMRERSLATPAA